MLVEDLQGPGDCVGPEIPTVVVQPEQQLPSGLPDQHVPAVALTSIHVTPQKREPTKPFGQWTGDVRLARIVEDQHFDIVDAVEPAQVFEGFGQDLRTIVGRNEDRRDRRCRHGLSLALKSGATVESGTSSPGIVIPAPRL